MLTDSPSPLAPVGDSQPPFSPFDFSTTASSNTSHFSAEPGLNSNIIFSPQQETILFLIKMMINVFGAVGNSLVVHVFQSKTDRRPSEYFILALGVVDCFFCVCSLLVIVVTKLDLLSIMALNIGGSILYSFTVFSSLYLVFAITINRGIAICRPHSYQSVFTLHLVMVILWGSCAFGVFFVLLVTAYFSVELKYTGSSKQRILEILDAIWYSSKVTCFVLDVLAIIIVYTMAVFNKDLKGKKKSQECNQVNKMTHHKKNKLKSKFHKKQPRDSNNTASEESTVRDAMMEMCLTNSPLLNPCNTSGKRRPSSPVIGTCKSQLAKRGQIPQQHRCLHNILSYVRKKPDTGDKELHERLSSHNIAIQLIEPTSEFQGTIALEDKVPSGEERDTCHEAENTERKRQSEEEVTLSTCPNTNSGASPSMTSSNHSHILLRPGKSPHRHFLQFMRRSHGASNHCSAKKPTKQSIKKVTFTLFLICVLFILLSLPYTVVEVTSQYCSPQGMCEVSQRTMRALQQLYEYTYVPYLTNFVVNPFVYFYTSSYFHSRVIALFQKCSWTAN